MPIEHFVTDGVREIHQENLQQSLTPADPLRGVTFRRGAKEGIRENRILQPFVAEVVGKVREFFGPEVTLSLTRSAGPHLGDPPLFLVVSSTMSVAEASSRLDRFDEEWWLDNAWRGGDELHVALDLW